MQKHIEHRRRVELPVIEPHYLDFGTWEYWYSWNRCPIVSKEDTNMAIIWKTDLDNASRRSLWFQEGEFAEVTGASLIGSFDTYILDGTTFSDWLTTYSIGTGKVYQHEIFDQINQKKLLTANGLAMCEMWENGTPTYDPNGNPSTLQTDWSGLRAMQGDINPDYTRTGDYTLIVIANNNNASTTGIIYGQGDGTTSRLGLEVYIDRASTKKLIDFSNFGRAATESLYLPEIIDEDDVRHIIVKVSGNAVNVYLNSVIVGRTNIAGYRDWLVSQGAGVSLFSDRGETVKLYGNLASLRLLDTAIPDEDIPTLYELDKRLWSLNPTPTQYYNFFVGGAGASYIPTATSLASLIDIGTADIHRYEVDGSNNVQCYITSTFDFSVTDAMSDSSITYLIDADGLSLTGDIVSGAANIEYLYVPNLYNYAQIAIQSSNKLKRLVSGVTVANDRRLISVLPALQSFDCPSLTSITTGTNGTIFENLTGLLRLKIINLTSISYGCEISSMYLSARGYIFSSVKSGAKIYYNSVLGVTDRNAFVRTTSGWAVGDTVEFNGLVYTCVAGAPTTDGEFQGDGLHPNTVHTNLKNAVNTDTRPGASDMTMVNDNALGAVRANVTGVAGNAFTASVGGSNTGSGSVSWATFQHGVDVHASLVVARDLRGANLIEVGAPITVDPPTVPGYSNVTATSFDISFTPPTPNANGTEAYEVWIDDGTPYRKHFYYREITATGTTIDLTEVVNDGGTVIGTTFKIRTMDGDMNFSDFTTEITIT
jgi:hypothetical protein